MGADACGGSKVEECGGGDDCDDGNCNGESCKDVEACGMSCLFWLPSIEGE